MLLSLRDRWQVTWTRPRAFLNHQSLSFGYGMESRIPTLIVTATETFNFQSSDLCAFLPPQKRILGSFWCERETTGLSTVVVLHNINLIAVKSAMYADGRSRTSWDQIEVCGFVQIRRNSSV